MFCLAELEGDFHASVKVGDEEFEELTTRQGIIQAPYMGRHKWILIDAHADFSQSEWEKYIAQSYELVKKKLPKKVKEKLGI